MTNPPAIDATVQQAERLRALHDGPSMLVLTNAWDAASARTVEAAGFPAIATTSGGVALALGYADGEHAPVEEMLAAARRMVAAVSVPVTVDFEAGYQLTPVEVARRLIAIGAAGMNLEDTDHHSGGQPRLADPDANAERLAAVKAAAKSEGVDLVLNARVDAFVRREGTPDEQFEAGLRRARLYREAGADCIYPIILADEAMIAEFVQAVGVVNITMRRGGPLSLAGLAELGVRRVSYATSIFREVSAATQQIVTEIHDEAAGLSG
jgi:2-methylisocitrate lyase-like PEP mutase family enzyme